MGEYIQLMLSAFAQGGPHGFSIGFFDLSFLLFIASTIGYTGYLFKRADGLWLLGFAGLAAGVAALTSALVLRWVAAGIGRPPWTNLYESLVFFSWGLVTCYTIVELRYKVKIAGAFIVPLVMVALGLASLTGDKEITPLVPALQNIWLYVHVFGASIAYAMFIVAFGFAVLYLFRDRVPMPYFHFAVSAFNAAAILAVTKGSVFTASYPLTKAEVFDGHIVKAAIPMTDPTEFYTVELPGLGLFLLVAMAFFVLAAVLSKRAATSGGEKAERLSFFALLFPTVLLGLALVNMAIQSGRYPGFFLKINGYSFALLFLGCFFGAMALSLHKAGDGLRQRLPQKDVLDDLVYKSIIFAFPILTFMLLSGAIWANQAWGRYWGWDPKETGALVTWMVYLAFLHTRISHGWSGRRTAVIAVVGFVSVIFTYLGVNLVLAGLHSYASA
ncbi:MAG: cytochrome c biogenesis protein CcsA [Deltaproteobacteria bacterium]|nr:cytochrome c biogenesis protein CcsA [Deltaproteobacteria bacterium]